jgi:hypothetical protein
VLLKVQRFHSCSFCAGAAAVNSAELECGQFDDEFVQALKGTVSKTDASTQVWLAYDPIPHIDIATSSMTIYMFYGHAVSHPRRSYYGPSDQQCANCRAVFWYGENVGKNPQGPPGSVIYNKCCKGGKVVIPRFRPRPEPLATLARFSGGPASNKFMKNIRQYNCLFCIHFHGS